MTDADSGITHIYLRQRFNGLEVANADLVVNVMRDGRVLNVAGGFISGIGGQAKTAAGTTPYMNMKRSREGPSASS